MDLYTAMLKACEENKFICNNDLKKSDIKIKPAERYCDGYRLSTGKKIGSRWGIGVNEFKDETWEVID